MTMSYAIGINSRFRQIQRPELILQQPHREVVHSLNCSSERDFAVDLNAVSFPVRP